MKRSIHTSFLILLTALSVCGCYEDYLKDYDYSSAYIAFQYDLRSFVVGEGMRFKVGVSLGGVMSNTQDRKVMIAIDDELVDGDLSRYVPGAESFTACQVMSGTSSYGSVSQDYVKTSVAGAGITALTPLPKELYAASSTSEILIPAGKHTGTISIQADSTALLADPNISARPFYAIGFRIVEADVDTVLLSKRFEVIAVRIENKFFGHWYHGGRTTVKQGETVISDEYYSGAVPQDDARVYELTTEGPYAVRTSRLGNGPGSLRLDFDGDLISVSSADGSKTIRPNGESRFNGAKLLQDRELYLNYCFDNADGSTTYITDTLRFRNRMRDGVNEWQDPNPDHYL